MTHYIEQAENCSRERMLRSMELLLETQSNLKWLTSPRALIEATLIKICRPYDERNFDALLDRLAMLEQRVASGAAVPQRDRAEIIDRENDMPQWAGQTEISEKDGEVREAAYQTLWYLSTAGIPLPPAQSLGIT